MWKSVNLITVEKSKIWSKNLRINWSNKSNKMCTNSKVRIKSFIKFISD